MQNNTSNLSTPMIAALGLAGLASGMGIGRFALTPLLPLMQQGSSISLEQGAWLAAANYVGYLLGAVVLILMPISASRAARSGLVVVSVLTLSMGFPVSLFVALLLRLGTGIASAFVLVGVSAWTLSALAERQRPSITGWVFAGVGVGIAVAGLVGLVAGQQSDGAETSWLILGVLASIVAIVAWKPLATSASLSPSRAEGVVATLTRDHWNLVGYYGAFGLGYIIPATFLPALARVLVNDPSIFGLVWPVFGAAAALSTVITSHLFGNVSPIRIWAYGHLVMAIGVLMPSISLSLWTISLSALCVGGTFMVVTMAGMQTAQAAASTTGPRLISVMTASFAAGQILGPIAVSAFAGSPSAIRTASFGATLVLLTSAWMLFRRALH